MTDGARRAAVYVRVSTASAAQRDSPANQAATCREYAEALGYAVPDELIYCDAGISGTEMVRRTEVRRLLDDARADRFGAVLFTAVSRFSRDLSDALSLKKTLEKLYGIRLISIEEGYDSAVDGRNSEMVFTVHAMLAAHKAQEMSRAIRRGLRQSARRGRHTGNVPPYGYRKNADRRLSPDPQTAPVVREIFRMYLSGKGVRTIAQILNAREIPTSSAVQGRGNTLWQASTVSAILRNEAYTGKLVAHRWTSCPDLEQSRRTNQSVKRMARRPPEEWITIPDSHEAIIDPDTFRKAGRLADEKVRRRGLRTNVNALAGLMVCGACGGAMIVTGGARRRSGTEYRYIVCGRTRRIGKSACENHFSTRYADLVSALREPLAQRMDESIRKLAPGRTAPDPPARGGAELDGRPRAQRAELDGRPRAQRAELDGRLRALRAELARNESAQRANLAAYRDNLFQPHLVLEDQARLTAQFRMLREEIEGVERELEDLRLRDSSRDVRPRLNLFRFLEDYDPLTRQLAFRTVVERIVFDPEGGVEVRFVWGPDRAEEQDGKDGPSPLSDDAG